MLGCMTSRFALIVVGVVLVALSSPAFAFRCGSRIVTVDMHEAEVRRACGAPTTMRHIGRALRDVDVGTERRHGGWTLSRHPGFRFTREVVVTEYVYNFGPRKLMRRLVFEGGILVSIEELGYGYRED